MFKKHLTRTNVFANIVVESGGKMQKVIKEYGIIILFYIIVIGGVLLLTSRLEYLNNQKNQIIAVSK